MAGTAAAASAVAIVVAASTILLLPPTERPLDATIASPRASKASPPGLVSIAPSERPNPTTPTSPITIPTPTIAFGSSVNDYLVRYPDGWTITPSQRRGDPDTLETKDYRWRGFARRLGGETTLEAFVAAKAPERCPTAAGGRSTTWDATEIDGRRALRRTACGFVDAAVIVGRDVYSFSLESRRTDANVLLFGRIGATIELPEPFASTVHDFTLSMPPAWDAKKATEPSQPDRFYGPRHVRLVVAAHQAETEPDPVAWAKVHFPRRSRIIREEQYCVARTTIQPVKDRQFLPSTIDGHPAATRSSCGYVDAAVVVGMRIFELSLLSPHVGAAGDDAAFAVLARRFDLGTADGLGPVWSGTFRSKLHGYVVRYPRDWTVSPATSRSSPDRFHALGSRDRLSVAVQPKPPGQGLEAYADALLPHHAKDDGCHWNGPGIIWIPAGPGRFHAATIADHPAVVRSECEFVEAVVDLGDEALVLVYRAGTRRPGAGRVTFDRFMARVEVNR
jgi:hypothetical protein